MEMDCNLKKSVGPTFQLTFSSCIVVPYQLCLIKLIIVRFPFENSIDIFLSV